MKRKLPPKQFDQWSNGTYDMQGLEKFIQNCPSYQFLDLIQLSVQRRTSRLKKEVTILPKGLKVETYSDKVQVTTQL